MRRIIVTLLILAGLLLMAAPMSRAQTDEPFPEERDIIFGGLAWSPDSDMLAVGARDGVWVYDVDTFEEILYKAQPPAYSVAWSPDGTLIASTYNDLDRNGELLVWDSASGQTFAVLRGHTSTTNSVAWSPDGQFIATSNWDQTVRVWELALGANVWTFDYPTDRPPTNDVDWSPDSRFVIAAGNPFSVWNVESGELINEWENSRHNNSIAWHPNRDIVASGRSWSSSSLPDSYEPGEVEIWDAFTGDQIAETIGDSRATYTVVWSPDGSRLATMGAALRLHGDQMMRIWDAETWALIAEFPGGIFTGDTFYANAIAWSPDGSKLASTSDDGRIILWDGETYELIGDYQLHAPLPRLEEEE